MKFSIGQWSFIAFLDVFFRLFASFVMGPALSALYLMSLISASAYVNTFNLRARTSIIITCVASNVLFFVVAYTAKFAFLKSASWTSCYAYKCTWEKGSLTWYGFQFLALEAAIDLAVNLIPLFAVYLYSTEIKRKTPQSP